MIPGVGGDTRDLPQEGMTLGEHKDDSRGGTEMRSHRSTRGGIVLASSEKRL